MELRYYPQESINEMMSRSMALLLRTARDEQREIGDELLLFFFFVMFSPCLY